MYKIKIIIFRNILYLILIIIIVYFFFIINNLFSTKDNINSKKTLDVSLYNYKGYKIHCTEINSFRNCLNGLIERKNRVKIIYIGNSQLHSINNFKKNQKLISEILFKNYINYEIDIITFSLPNINLEETLWILKNLLGNIEFSYLILPLVFDDFREYGLRNDLVNYYNAYIKGNENKHDLYIKGNENKHDLYIKGNENKHDLYIKGNENIIVKDLKKIKDKLNQEKNNLAFNLYKLRNLVFGINSSTRRVIIKSNYLTNLNSYKEIHYLIKKNNIRLISYFAPLRQEPNIIYDPLEYKKFKDEITNLNIQFNQKIFDLDNVVKSQNFGLIDKKNLDYMHFDYEGHLVLFNEIKNILDNKIKIKNDF